jgi:protein-tyrosine-phosphatase
MASETRLEIRASRHAALGDPMRLAIVEALGCCDRSPAELGRRLGIGSNLLAHHLDALESVGLIERTRSSGDGRRRYVHLRRDALDGLIETGTDPARSALFICSANSARSQLAEALWRSLAEGDCCSAGTHPAERVHPGAVDAARRAGLDLSDAEPRLLDDLDIHPDVIITVCDRAHEQLEPGEDWLHWSIPDPAETGSPEDFDAVVGELTRRIEDLLASSTDRPITRPTHPTIAEVTR